MKTLEQQIAEQTEKITRDFNFKSEIETLLGQYNPTFSFHQHGGKDWLLWIDLTKWPKELDISGQLANIVATLKPTDVTREYEYGSKKVISYSPFRLQWGSSVSGSEVSVRYMSNKIEVWVKMPISFYDKIVRRSSRTPNDCEDHYFGGYSRKEMQEVRIAVNQSNYYQDLAWYGGDHTTYCNAPEHTKQFNQMVLTGEQPLG